MKNKFNYYHSVNAPSVAKQVGINSRLIFLFSILGFVFPCISNARDYHVTPDNYLKYVSNVVAGDRIYLSGGVYKKGLPLYFKNGNAKLPIVIEGPSKKPFAVFLAHNRRNTVSIVDSSYIIIRNIQIDGNRQFVDGIKAEGHSEYAHHITLENITIYNQGKHQQIVGISTKCPAWSWLIRGIKIYGAGTGMYLGNSDGYAPFFNSVIEDSKIWNTIGYNIQIKHQIIRREEVPGIPQQDGETIIRNNIFGKSENASDKGMARPNVLVGHWPLGGAGKEDVYKIYNNVFYRNPNEALFQGEGNIQLYNNIFFNDEDNEFPAIAIQRHNCIPRKINIFNNTVITKGTGIRVKDADSNFEQLVTDNRVFADVPLIGGKQKNNQHYAFDELNEEMPQVMSLLNTLSSSDSHD